MKWSILYLHAALSHTDGSEVKYSLTHFPLTLTRLAFGHARDIRCPFRIQYDSLILLDHFVHQAGFPYLPEQLQYLFSNFTLVSERGLTKNSEKSIFSYELE